MPQRLGLFGDKMDRLGRRIPQSKHVVSGTEVGRREGVSQIVWTDASGPRPGALPADPVLESTSVPLSTRNQPAVPGSLLSLGAHPAPGPQLSSPSLSVGPSGLSRAPWHQEPILGGAAPSSRLPRFLCLKPYVPPSCSWREKSGLQRLGEWFL